jgi:tagaturonate reductase
LLSFLYKRYKTFHGDETKGMVIIPTELVVDNGKKLFSILMELSQQNDLENDFIKWMQNANHFCSSLVDRIVPGKLNAPEQNIIQTKFGYEDELMIMSEAYKLWAIESSDKKVKEVLSFADADSGIIVAPDIAFFRELKLRLLNGSHTFSCGLAFLAGFATVKDAMNNESFSAFIKKLMLEEIAPAIETENISLKEANDFALKVLDRYRNPFIEHQWLSITLQYSSKMQMRNLPTLKNYVDRFKKIPLKMALGFAGYILFMRPVEFIDNKYYGEINGRQYFINDDKASYFYEIWKSGNINFVVNAVAENKMLWNEDLSLTEGFSEAVKNYLHLLIDFGAKKTIDQLI